MLYLCTRSARNSRTRTNSAAPAGACCVDLSLSSIASPASAVDGGGVITVFVIVSSSSSSSSSIQLGKGPGVREFGRASTEGAI